MARVPFCDVGYQSPVAQSKQTPRKQFALRREDQSNLDHSRLDKSKLDQSKLDQSKRDQSHREVSIAPDLDLDEDTNSYTGESGFAITGDLSTRTLTANSQLVNSHSNSSNSHSSNSHSSNYGELQQLLDDPSIEEIWINSPQRVFVARSGKSELTNLVLTSQQVQSIMDRILLWSGRRIDLAQPFVDARLPDGSRLHITIPEITSEHWAINIRKHLLRGKSLNDLVELDVMDLDVCAYLVGAVKERKNLLVSGSTQAGKTTLLNALVSSIPVTERVITIEEVFELKPKLPDCVAMQTRTSNLDGSGEISIRRLIKEALRMRPSRLIIGEIREAESLDLLIALNSGIPGMATLHANSAREAIRKLQTLPMLAGENITQEFLTPTVARAIDLVVHVGMDTGGKRRILQVLGVSERTEAGHIDCEDVFTWNGTEYEEGIGYFA
ncbi:MAG: CpaF family protein [Actinobacteria bacterium]|nr:CpaF family protein [Actinomycetota bacterium]